MLKINPKMTDAFRQYYGVKRPSQSIQPTTLANRILYFMANQKAIEVVYLDAGDKVQSFLLRGQDTLAKIQKEQGEGFILVHRGYLVNPMALTGVFPVSADAYGCSVQGTGAVLPVSRRQVKAARSAYASLNVHV